MKIKNRSAGTVVYAIEDLNIRRHFAAGEVKDIPQEEIQKLLYQPGGPALFERYLQVSDKDMIALGFGEQEPEYFYSAEDIKNIMVNGTLNEFLDFLDFAPEGAITIAKELAVKLPLSDMNKAEGLKKATGFDVIKAIGHMKAVEQDLNGEIEVATTSRKRRAEVPTAISTVESKYKVIG
jgi:hypothetical protein